MSRNRRLLIKRYIFLLLSVAVAGLIFYFSSQTATNSDKESRGFIWNLLDVIPCFAGMSEAAKLGMIEGMHTLVRKMAHFSIYAALGFFVINYILTYFSQRSKALLTSVAVCFFYACSDELHQLLVPGRSGEVRDVLIDTCGAFTGMCFMLLLMLAASKLRRDKNE